MASWASGIFILSDWPRQGSGKGLQYYSKTYSGTVAPVQGSHRHPKGACSRLRSGSTDRKEPEPIDLDSETFEAEEPVKEKKDTGKMSGFISDQKDKGLSNEEIRQKLLGKGLSDDEVDKHMNKSRE